MSKEKMIQRFNNFSISLTQFDIIQLFRTKVLQKCFNKKELRSYEGKI